MTAIKVRQVNRVMKAKSMVSSRVFRPRGLSIKMNANFPQSQVLPKGKQSSLKMPE